MYTQVVCASDPRSGAGFVKEPGGAHVLQPCSSAIPYTLISDPLLF